MLFSTVYSQWGLACLISHGKLLTRNRKRNCMNEKFQLNVYRHKCGTVSTDIIINISMYTEKTSVLEDSVLMKNGTTQSDICM